MLDLNQLDTDDIPGLDRQKGNNLANAAGVCLEDRNHAPGVQLNIRGIASNQSPVTWSATTAQIRRTWADMQEATEKGAEGVAVLLTIQEIGQSVLLRSMKGTAVDYWLGDRDVTNVSVVEREKTDELRLFLEDDDLVVRARMEVSGILNGNDSLVRSRRNEKLDRISRTDPSALPAYVVVVEFGRPLAEVTRK